MSYPVCVSFFPIVLKVFLYFDFKLRINTLLLADMSHKSLLTYKFPHPFLFWGVSYLLMILGICLVEFLIFWMWLVVTLWCCVTCSFIPCLSCKLVVRFGGLIRFKFTFKTEVKFTYREIHRSQMYCLLSLDKCIHSCNPSKCKKFSSPHKGPSLTFF